MGLLAPQSSTLPSGRRDQARRGFLPLGDAVSAARRCTRPRGRPARGHLALRRRRSRRRAPAPRRPPAPAAWRSAASRGRYFMPQSGAAMSSPTPLWGSARRMRSATVSAVSTSAVSSAMTPRMIVLPGSASSTERSRPDCAVSIEIWSTGAGRQLGQEAVRRRMVRDEGGIAEADVQGGRPLRRRRARAAASARRSGAPARSATPSRARRAARRRRRRRRGRGSPRARRRRKRRPASSSRS